MQKIISHSSLEKVLAAQGIVRKGESVVVGVSGGADSMVLLDLFSRIAKRWSLSITVAHVNHGLRGRASVNDMELVRKTALKMGFPFEVAKWKAPERGNLQDAARKFRYAFFKKVARRAGAQSIAIAHTKDDQAETVLLHLVRGSGLAGMAGMEWAGHGRPRVIRPLLGFHRSQIERYAKSRNIRFAHDSSNDRTKYSRNYVRHNVLPLLETLNPAVRKSLADTACVIRECVKALDDVTGAFADEFLREGKRKIAWNRDPYIRLPAAIRSNVLILAYERLKGDRADLLSDHIRRMESISMGKRGCARYMLPGRIAFHRTHGLISLECLNS